VLEVPAGSPAAQAGLRPTHRDIFGDIILGDVIVGGSWRDADRSRTTHVFSLF
jgi:hypothetical protein